MQSKSEIRKEIRSRKRQFTETQLHELSVPIMQRLLAHPRLQTAQTVLIYYSLPDEVYTHNTINVLLQKGKTVLLPRVIDDENMEIRHYEGKKDLAEGTYHIMEPTGRIFNNYTQIDLAVVPGMSFDNNHNRLGRGKGYYDRFLRLIPDVYKIGICFEFQKLEHIPAGIHDIRMNEIL